MALLDATTGALVIIFKPPTINGIVKDQMYRAGNLYITGDFTHDRHQRRGWASPTWNGTAGTLTNEVTVDLTERHDTDATQVQKAMGATSLDITKNSGRMVIIGNFRKANGLDRDQVVQINITGTSSSNDYVANEQLQGALLQLRERLDRAPACRSPPMTATSSSVRAEAAVPSWEPCATPRRSGGPATPSTTSSRSGSRPPVATRSGAVEVTEKAVYIGGHQRWMNNSDGSDYAGPGAVPRPGLAALDPGRGSR